MLEVPADMHAWRIDKTLAVQVSEFSRSYLQQLVSDGAVTLRGMVCRKPSTRVQAGDKIRVELRPTQQAMAFVPQPMDLDVAYEDDDLIVVRKPAGLVVHPAAGNWSGTLLNGLLAHHPEAVSLPRAGIVHRLDKDTSGLMMVGKSRRAVDALVKAIAAREVHREYVALAHGAWNHALVLDVDRAIGRDPVNRLRMAVLREDHAGAKSARTTVELIESNDKSSLVRCKLHTGRTHQIRVHMACLGHPLVGDALYGGRLAWGLQRQALHAFRLRFAHPVTGVPLSFHCPPPTDLICAVQQAGLHYNFSSPEL
ncbi:MAG: RluA family pseudouridine synthase [Hydrogenophaga sp.]|nr:RluA family pseudouridine synthase [Hydrogenophaga sp.]